MSALEAARAWRDQDPDETTRAELDALIEAALAGETVALEERFASRLEFGTAGLRGELGAGPSRMNRVLVAQAAAGLAAYLLEREAKPSIVIGYDGRINSEIFARDSAAIMAGAGVHTTLLPRPLPTPVLAFGVRQLAASAGVMVTASHNPARDNGYKVYLGGADNGSQIVPPDDAEIAAEIHRAAQKPISELPRSHDFAVADDSILEQYVRATARLAHAPRPLRFVYTAMHGVGWETAQAVFAASGFTEPLVVAEQIDPDPAFPTVAFPNPEEPGAMDLILALAEKVGADIAIANDPDADRLAVAIPTASGWRRLSGNEVGWLLGWRAAERVRANGTAAPGTARVRSETARVQPGTATLHSETATLATSIVSSPALRAVAREYQLGYTETLTGFKWISRVPELAYGYEEALGYLVDPDKVLDKDGISAAVDVVSLASELLAAGETVEERLLAFAARFGGFASGQISLRVADLAEIDRMMTRLRTNPPSTIGPLAVTKIDDFIDGFEQYPASDILRFTLEDDARVIVRPSGTEPKLKVYLDAVSTTTASPTSRLSTAAATITALTKAMQTLLT